VAAKVELVALVRRRRKARPAGAAGTSGIAVSKPALGVGGERLAARLPPYYGKGAAFCYRTRSDVIFVSSMGRE
jgi:hypothetical protein